MLKNARNIIYTLLIILVLGGIVVFRNYQQISQMSYLYEARTPMYNLKPHTPTKIVFQIKNNQGKIVKDFSVVHEKLLHFIVVRGDLQEFQHIHPLFDKTTGAFSIDVTFPTDGYYHLLPHFTPAEDNPQHIEVVAPYDVRVGDMSLYKRQPVVPDVATTKVFGDYEVQFIMPKNPKAGQTLSYSVIITKNGKPVTDLEKYLGAYGHSIVIRDGSTDSSMNHDTQSHNHSMPMLSETFGPSLDFSGNFSKAGLYKIFTQFQHQGKVITTDYVLKVNEHF